MTRVRLREVSKVLGPSPATVRRALDAGCFRSAQLEPGNPGSPGVWTVEAVELAEWMAARVTRDPRLRSRLTGAIVAELYTRFGPHRVDNG